MQTIGTIDVARLRREARNGANSDQDIDFEREQFGDERGDTIPVPISESAPQG